MSAGSVALSSRMARAAAGGMLYSVLANAMIYVGQITVARSLTRAEYATFSVVISFLALIGMFADLGWTPQLIKRFAEAEADIAKGQIDRRGMILGTGLIAKLLISLLVSILGMAIAYPIYGPRVSYLAAIGMVTFFVSSRHCIFRTVLESFARGEGKFDLVLKFAALDGIVFGGLLYAWSRFGLSLTAVVAIYSFCHLPGLILLTDYIRKIVKVKKIAISFDVTLVKDLFVSSFPIALGIIFLAIHNSADTLILERLSDDHQVSAYAASFRVMAGLMFLPVVLTGVVIPEFIKLLNQREIDRAVKLSQFALQGLISSAIIIALLISSLAPLIIELTIGDQYSDASQLAIIFGWIFLPIVFVSLFLELAMAVGKQRIFGAYSFVLAIITIAADLIVAKPYGALGVVIVKLGAMLAGCGVIVLMSRRHEILSKVFRSLNWGKNVFSLVLPLAVMALLSAINVPMILSGMITAAVFCAWSIKLGLIDMSLLSTLVKTLTKR
jgi:O-antigen/teichoic acid export membrane protein